MEPNLANQSTINYQQQTIKVIVAVLLAFILGAVAVYLWYGSSKPKCACAPCPPSSPAASESSLAPADWKTYTIMPDESLGYASYQIKVPQTWKQIEHSSNFQNKETFQDGQNMYQLVIGEQKNYNDQTGKPFTDLKEFTGFPYDLPTLNVDGQQASKVLPRAGSETIYEVLFFSRDAKIIYNLTLETPRNGSKAQEGEVLFNQILSTFRFTE